ncbi:MAG: type II secretion system protein GspJ [Desulfosalsimonadaceae bacterium]
MTHRSDRGSTLIELLISLSILGVILLIILGAFRIGIRAWETGDRDVESSQRQQMAFSILKRQLSSASSQPIVTEEDEEPFVFRGDAESVAFISTVAVVPGNEAGNVRVGYRVGVEEEGDGYYLEITEQNVLNQSGGKSRGAAGEPVAYRLLSGVHSVSFEYLEMVPEMSEWHTEWNAEEDTGLPAAVRCIVRMDEKKPPITVVARMLPETDTR